LILLIQAVMIQSCLDARQDTRFKGREGNSTDSTDTKG